MPTMTTTDPTARRADTERKFSYILGATPVGDEQYPEDESSDVDELRQMVERLKTQNSFLIDRLVVAENNIEMLITMLGARDIPSPLHN
ncbi:MAG: hypothetical protein H7836_06495 [Magnetococcus sp. YQC-3]